MNQSVRVRPSWLKTASLRFPVVICLYCSSLVLFVDSFAWTTRRAPRRTLNVPRTTSRSTLQATVSQSHAVVAATAASIKLAEPTTNVTVILVGCLHGSTSSALDVQTILDATQPDAVALELCASRFVGFTSRELTESDSDSTVVLDSPTNGLPGYVHGIQSLTRTHGAAVGLVAAVLTATSTVQAALFRLQPGLEFQTAIEYCTHDTHATTDGTIRSSSSIDIVLVDQNVQVTLRRLSDIPNVAVQLVRDFGREWNDQKGDCVTAYASTLGVEHDALQFALWGNKNKNDATAHDTVSLGSFLTRSRAAVSDVLVWMFAAISLNVGSRVLCTTVDTGTVTESIVHAHDAPLAWVLLLVANALVMVGLYHALILPAARVVLRERDDGLVHGIRRACRLVHDSPSSSHTNRTVVAVLGLLHVNGVARQLVQQQSETTPCTLPATSQSTVARLDTYMD